MLKLALGLLLVLASIPLTQFALLYARSEARLRDYQKPTPFAAALPDDAATIARGRHLVTTRGCSGCHGEDLGGSVLSWAGRAVAVNLTRYVREHDLATFERALRHGIGAEGKALVSMPSYMYRTLTDEDVASIAAYLHSQPAIKDRLPRPRLNREARRKLVDGDWRHMAELTKLVPARRHQNDSNPALAKGEYLALTACSECHGLDVRGWVDVEEGWFAPDLAIAASYSPEDFRRLMHEGIALGDRELEMMSGVARKRFSILTEEQCRDLHAYLATLPGEPVAENVPWRRLQQ